MTPDVRADLRPDVTGRGQAPESPGLGALAVVVARGGELPPGAAEAVTEAGGTVLVIGDGAAAAADAAVAAARTYYCDTGAGLQPGLLARRLAPVVAGVPLLVLPGSPDGRDLAPRLAAVLGRPLLANACRAVRTDRGVLADLCRLDDQVVIPAQTAGPAVVTIAPGTGVIGPDQRDRVITPAVLPAPDDRAGGAGPDVTAARVLEPDPATMELAEAPAVLSGGGGLAAGLDQAGARAAFDLLGRVAAALGAAAGATRVATDAGWIDADRQIGTTGVSITARLYIALGVSGATQHAGGLGSPATVVSVNTDPHCPMTAMSSLGIVADARGTLVALAARLGVPVPPALGAPAQKEMPRGR
jgi:electron transfer flavoprotein alpha subunit